MKNKCLLLKNYVKIQCDNESAIFIIKYIDAILNDFKMTLERFDSLLKIQGINSKMMVRNDIQAILKDIENMKEGK